MWQCLIHIWCCRLSGAPALQCCLSSHRCHHAATAYTSPPSALHVGRAEARPARGLARLRPAGSVQPRLSLYHPKDKLTSNIENRKLPKVRIQLYTVHCNGRSAQDKSHQKKSGKERMLDEKKNYHVSFSLTPQHSHNTNRVQTIEIQEKTLWRSDVTKYILSPPAEHFLSLNFIKASE